MSLRPSICCFALVWLAALVSPGAATTIAGAGEQSLLGELRWEAEPESTPEGAAWRLDGGEWLAPSHQVEGLLPGRYKVQFARVHGWREPDSLSPLVIGATTTRFEAKYHRVHRYYAKYVPLFLAAPKKGLRLIVESNPPADGPADGSAPIVTLKSVTADPDPAGPITFDPATGELNYVPASSDLFPFKLTFSFCINEACANDELGTRTITITPTNDIPPEAKIITFENRYQPILDRDVVALASNDKVILKASELIIEPGNANLIHERFNGAPLGLLEIFAEKLIVRGTFTAPSTDVFIYAREVLFDGGQIDVSGLNAPQTRPGNAGDGANGQAGSTGGSVQLLAEKFSSTSDAPCFITKGGTGQPAGLGINGSPGESYPCPVQPTCGYRDPYGLVRGYCPVYWSAPWGWLGVNACPTNGKNAKCAGIPGSGGNGGSLTSNLDLANHFEALPGQPGAPGAATRGGRAGTPTKACKLYLGWGNQCNGCTCNVVDIYYCPTTRNGTDCPARVGPSGRSGEFSRITEDFLWIHPAVLSLTVERAKNMYLHGDSEGALEILQGALQAYAGPQKPALVAQYGDLAFTQLENEIKNLLHRIQRNLDYFGNPPGWVPRLSFEANSRAFENESKAAIPILYFVKFLKAAAAQDRASIEMLDILRGELTKEIARLTEAYNGVYKEIPKVLQAQQALLVRIEYVRNQLIVLDQALQARARENVEERHKKEWWEVAIGVAGNVLEILPIPFLQPYAGIAGSILSGIAEGGDIIGIGQSVFGSIDGSQYEGAANEFYELINATYSSFGDLAGAIAPVIGNFAGAAQDIAGLFQDYQAPLSEVEAELSRLRAQDPLFNDLTRLISSLNQQKLEYAQMLTSLLEQLGNLMADIQRVAVTIETADQARASGGRFDATGVAYLEAMEKRTRERLLYYHYVLAKSYQYLVLKPFPGDLALSTHFLEKLEGMIFANPVTHELLPLRTQVDFGDPENAFAQLRLVFVEELREIVSSILFELNRNGTALRTTASFELSEEELKALNELGEVWIDLAKKNAFGLREEDIRIVRINAKEVRATSGDSKVSLLLEHSGIVQMRKNGETIYFQHYQDFVTNPIVWTTTIEANQDTWVDSVPSPSTESLVCFLLDIDCSDNLSLFAHPGGLAKFRVRKGDSSRVIKELQYEVEYDFRAAPSSYVFLNVETVGNITPDLHATISVTSSDLNNRGAGQGAFTRTYAGSTRITISAEPVYGQAVFERFIVNPNSNPVERSDNPMTLNLGTDTRVRAVYREPTLCGNGLCGPNETKCNCPSDCRAPVASRMTTGSYCPEEETEICIDLDLPSSAVAVGLEDCPPDGWTVRTISNAGTWDSANRKVKWGPFFTPLPSRVCYQATPPADAEGLQAFRCGSISIDGAVGVAICENDFVGGSCCPPAPADTPGQTCPGCTDCRCGECEDSIVELCEVIGYACSWKKGCHDDLANVIRSAFLWKDGSPYCWDASTVTWNPSVDELDHTCCTPTVTAEAMELRESGGAHGYIQSLMNGYQIRVVIDVPVGTLAIGWEFDVPLGWRVDSVTENGVWDQLHGKVKWGPFFDDSVRSAELILVANDSTLIMPNLKGTVSFDGFNQPINWHRLKPVRRGPRGR